VAGTSRAASWSYTSAEVRSGDMVLGVSVVKNRVVCRKIAMLPS
jgi:hypothetical protein